MALRTVRVPPLGGLAAALVAACSGSTLTVQHAPPDSGTTGADASAPVDAGSPDAGGGDGGKADSGLAPDSGASQDGGRTDAGVPFDAGPDSPIGVDMPDLLRAYVGVAATTPADVRLQMDHAVASGFNHARFIASGFWPTEMTTGNGWVANPAGYWAAFDQMVADARARGLRLVPSILWNVYLFPDLAHAPVGQLFVRGSATRQMAEQYITQMVSRYAGDDVILFWEIGNEMNLVADLDVSTCNVCDGGTNNCGGLAPPLGTPCQRSAADDYYSCNNCRGVTSAQEDLGQFAADIAALIHSLDPSHPVSSGDGYPRASAYHLSVSPCPACDWTLDTPAQYALALAQLHPAGVDLVSVHHYPGPDNQRFGSDDTMGIDLLARTQTLVTGMDKKLFVGEYGESLPGTIPACGGGTQVCGGDPQQVFTHRLLDAFVTQGVPYASVWAFEWNQFCPTASTCLNVLQGDGFSGSMTTHDLAYGACSGLANGSPCSIGKCAAGVCSPVPGVAYDFDVAGQESPWIHWTNCTACTPGSFQRVAVPDGGYLALTSADLPCDGDAGCGFPGAYAQSAPAFALSPGHALLSFGGRSTAGDSVLHLWVTDGTSNVLAEGHATVPQGTGFTSSGAWVTLPPNTAGAYVRVDLTSPQSELDLHWLNVVWEP